MNYFKLSFTVSLFIVHLLEANPSSSKDSLKIKMQHIIERSNGKVGVAVLGLENNDTLVINGNDKFPMQSVFKLPLAMAVLHQVDEGKLFLDQKIFVRKDDLLPNLWSPLREKYPGGNVNITLDELLFYTVSMSDNSGCDILFRLIGGPKIVDRYIHSLGITDISIVSTEEEMQKEWDVQYNNWSTPAAMNQLLSLFFHDKILLGKYKEYLWNIMVKTSTGSKRIKGMLPEGTIVAHKTGSSGTNNAGMTAATNDVGIVTLPNGNHFAIVVFVSNSSSDEKTREGIIADISRAAWEVYLKQ
jgi:beta-lactamase class A